MSGPPTRLSLKPARNRAWRGAALVLAAMGLWSAFLAPAPAARAATAADASDAQARLGAIRERIEKVSRELAESLKARDRQSADLRQTELAMTAARHQLDELNAQQKALERQQQELGAARDRIEAELRKQRAALAAELRLAQRLHRTGPLQLLLTQDDPLRAARMLTYYGYFGRARATQIDAIRQQGDKLQALEQSLRENEAALAVLMGQRQKNVAELELQRQERATVLASLKRESQDRSQALARLRAQQAELEQLLKNLARSLRDAPQPVPSGAFAALRGKLSWPVSGKLLAQFGQQRTQGVRWEGVVIGTERAAEVRAIAAGRMVYSDWLPGLGLLAIVDHGSGYLSLYGHNDALRRSVGESVAAGEVIASAGDSGGSSRPELYFEIRQGGKPVNPAPWFRRRTPD